MASDARRPEAPARNGPTPAAPASDRSWEARPYAARAIRVAVLLGPISIGCVAAITANRLITPPSGSLTAIGRALAIVAASTAVVWAVDRYARKLLPLAALMQLSLVFPDQAPSRFRSALKSGSSRRLERTLEDTRRNGLAKDPGDAARQVVQLIGAIGDHDRRTRGHSERVRLYADLVGEELKLSKEDRQKLQWGALLHDLGKLMVPSEILNKKGKPDDDEWRVLQGHPAAGMKMIEPLRGFLGEWVHAIGGHHEKWDGSGYPAGLKGGDIPLAAAIVAVADSFEVMTAVRSYKKAMPLAEARAELTRCAGSHFSPEVVRAFLSISLGHLRLVSGPLAALAHLPFLGNLAQLPGTAASMAPALVNAAAIPAAAAVTAAALTLAPQPKADALELTRAEAPPTSAITTTVPMDGGQVATGPEAGAPAAEGAAAATDPASPTGVAGAGLSAGTTTTTSGTAAAGEVTTTLAPTAASPTTTIEPAPTTAARPATTTTAKPVTTTTAPKATTTTAPTTTTPSPTTTAAPAATFDLQVSTNSLRLGAQNLNGASYAHGTKIYVFAMISADEVKYVYPGGTRTESSFPFDMMGNNSLAANSYTLPATPGTYTVTATSKSNSGPGSTQKTATATFTVT